MSLDSDTPRGLGDFPQPLLELIRGTLVPTWLMLVSMAQSTSSPWVRPGSRVSSLRGQHRTCQQMSRSILRLISNRIISRILPPPSKCRNLIFQVDCYDAMAHVSASPSVGCRGDREAPQKCGAPGFIPTAENHPHYPWRPSVRGFFFHCLVSATFNERI